MTGPVMIGPEAEDKLSWSAVTDAIVHGHAKPHAEIGDTFLYRNSDTLLSRAAWIDGLGVLVKSATIFPENPKVGLPTIGGAACLFRDDNGALDAVIDFPLLTKWKTAGDSLLGAIRLARPDSQTILIIGAGTVAASLIQAYSSHWPAASFLIWNRSPVRAADLAARYPTATAVSDLAGAAAGADIIACATMSTEPVLRGDWLRPGQHIDLIGAYRPDMREVDDTAITRSRLFVDSRETTIGHIGELKDPIARGVIGAGDIIADFYDLQSGQFARKAPDEITIFKNGGGAHLDLMVAAYMRAAL
ncbi:MAG: ornithine cyclodeaminase [Pseudomonadota bacterium]